MNAFRLVLAGVLLLGSVADAGEDPAQKLRELESQIAKTPDNPMLLYRKAQYLMKFGKAEEGYRTAKDALAVFVKNRNNLAWMMLEQIDLGHVRVDVHFNMGPRERRPPELGIIRPLSFRVWTKGKDPALLGIIDFEIGLFDGKPSAAALGQTTGGVHGNFGILPTDATYTKIRERLVEIVKSRYKNPNRATDSNEK